MDELNDPKMNFKINVDIVTSSVKNKHNGLFSYYKYNAIL